LDAEKKKNRKKKGSRVEDDEAGGDSIKDSARTDDTLA